MGPFRRRATGSALGPGATRRSEKGQAGAMETTDSASSRGGVSVIVVVVVVACDGIYKGSTTPSPLE